MAKPPAASVADGYEPQGYVAVPVKLDVSRGTSTEAVEWTFRLQEPGVCLVADSDLVGRIFKITVYTGDKADAQVDAVLAKGDTESVVKHTYADEAKVTWAADFWYWKPVSAVLNKDVDKGTAPTLADVAEFYVKPHATGTFAPVFPEADRDYKLGDTVTGNAVFVGRKTGYLYPGVSDNDYTTADAYPPSQQNNANINPAVQKTGSGIGKDNFIYGRAIPGGRFFTEETADLTKVGIYPSNTTFDAADVPDYSEVPSWFSTEFITTVKEDGTETKWHAVNGTGWVTGESTLEADVILGFSGTYGEGEDWTLVTASGNVPDNITDLNRFHGIDFDQLLLDSNGEKVNVDHERIWPKGVSVLLAAGLTAHWAGTRFEAGTAPAVLPNSTDTFVSV